MIQMLKNAKIQDSTVTTKVHLIKISNQEKTEGLKKARKTRGSKISVRRAKK